MRPIGLNTRSGRARGSRLEVSNLDSSPSKPMSPATCIATRLRCANRTPARCFKPEYSRVHRNPVIFYRGLTVLMSKPMSPRVHRNVNNVLPMGNVPKRRNPCPPATCIATGLGFGANWPQ